LSHQAPPSTDAEFNPFLPAFQEDPVRAFHALREKDPVHHKGSRSDVKIEFNMLLRGIPSLPVTW
jgi:hypothetical protein